MGNMCHCYDRDRRGVWSTASKQLNKEKVKINEFQDSDIETQKHEKAIFSSDEHLDIS